uniref:Uncharacterized protein n=1 Tax=Romanomermis culicivorax TaxID=13658 RepID=A0A915KCX4_ROMCU
MFLPRLCKPTYEDDYLVLVDSAVDDITEPTPMRIQYPCEMVNCMTECPGGCARQPIIGNSRAADLDEWLRDKFGTSKYSPSRMGVWRCCDNDMRCYMPNIDEENI